MRSVWKLTWTEIKLYLREPLAAFFTLVFPLMMLSMFGSIFGNRPLPFSGGLRYIDTAVPAFTAMIIATSGLMTLPVQMAWYREGGVLRRLNATPLRPETVLAAQVMLILLMNVLGMALLVIAAKAFFGLRFPGNALNVVAAFILSSLSFFALGFVLAGVMPTARTAQVVSMVLYFPMLFLSGAGIPRELLPETFRQYAQALPLTHVVTLLRGTWAGEAWGEHLTDVGVLVALLVASVIVSAKTFRWE